MRTGGLLEANEVTKVFGGHRAVDGVSFSLAEGGITGLIGPNGAGKTTLFNVLAGHLKASSGQVRLRDRDISGSGAAQVFAAGLGRTFQIPRPFALMSVLENVMLGARGQRGERFWVNWIAPRVVAAQERQIRDAARHWLDFVGLAALEQQPAAVLSGGQRKLLELARVMVAEPLLVLLDEPGAGVNPALLDRIVDRISTLNAQGTAFLIVEHNLDLVSSICGHVMVMAEGRLLVEGDARTVLADPRVIEAYLGELAGAATA